MSSVETPPVAVERGLVTVLAVCFNHARFVRECLDSIAAQTYPHVELIVLDDASTDGSVREIEGWIASSGRDVRFVAHRENRGLCATLNEGRSFARGEFVAVIATDDLWFPEKLERQVAFFATRPESTAVVYSDAVRIDAEGRPLPQSFLEVRGRFANPPDGDVLDVLAYGNFIPAMTALIRRRCLDRVGPWDERLLYEDWDMWLRLAHHYEFAWSDYVSAKYRVLDSSLARSALRAGNVRWHLSEFLIAERWAKEPKLGPAVRQRLAREAATHACDLYVSGHPEAATFLARALRLERSFRLVAFAVAAACGISHPTLARLKRRLLGSAVGDRAAATDRE